MTRRPGRVTATRAMAVVAASVAVALSAAPGVAQAVSSRAGANPWALSGNSLSGGESATWRVTAKVDQHPLRTGEGPSAAATAHLPPAGCTAPGPGLASSPGRPTTGEGIVSLTMAAPGTSWASVTNTAVDVDISVDGRPSQQVVLFDGAEPFSYQGFLGQLSTGAHCLKVTVDPALSSDLATAVVDVYSARLTVVPVSSPDYQLITHAPVMYGRSSSAERNGQILTDGTATRDATGNVDLSYTVIWTREDVGDGLAPAYEWGLWGRMTDIETVLTETVAPDGAILAAKYLSCGCEQAPIYPDETPAPPVDSEKDVAYPASGTPPALDRHLVLRDATGNNDMSPYGTSSYRFQQVPVAGPLPGQAREVAMDQHPWTYRLSNDEVARTTPRSTDPRSPLGGDYPQYLIVDANVAATGTSSIAIGVQLAGDPTWWTDDYAQTTGIPTTFPFYNGGHGRTVIKLPVGWHGTAITGLRLVLNAPPGSPTPSLRGSPVLSLLELTRDYQVRTVAAPSPTVTTGTQLLVGLPS